MTDYGKYHDDIYDLVEFRDGVNDVVGKYQGKELNDRLASASNNIQESIQILIEKAMKDKLEQTATCICGHMIKFDGKDWYHTGHSLSLNCSHPIPKDSIT